MNHRKAFFNSIRLCFIALLSSICCVCLCEKSPESYRSRTDELVEGGSINNIQERFKRSLANNSLKHKVTEEKKKRQNIKGGFKKHNKGTTKTKNFHLRRFNVAGKDQMKLGFLQLPTFHKTHDVNSVKRQHLEDDHQFGHLNERPILGRCDINEQCKADQYCEGTYCYKCRKDQEHCYANGQCCKGAECQYGYCAKGVSAGMPGTYCDKAKDCKGDSCCILEMSVDHHNAICKPMLEEHETCGPINLFHQITEYRAHNEPICGPCKEGLACKSIGIHGHHSVCLPEGAD